ncbi:MAG: hypothetical protein CBARDCOR_5745 [uncultured Caballeronia sp.]|nr:MAG: hypothetical protein CBARDCOR_5745 [uncultured Caballeronia sp.]
MSIALALDEERVSMHIAYDGIGIRSEDLQRTRARMDVGHAPASQCARRSYRDRTTPAAWHRYPRHHATRTQLRRLTAHSLLAVWLIEAVRSDDRS